MILIRGASEHNLKEVDVELPRGALTFVTGPSGSGKSSLAFDTLCREGQRRFLETFSSYARQFLARLALSRVRAIQHLSPAVPLAQRPSIPSPRSTVGTQTELYDLLRLLFARLGRAPANLGVTLQRSLFSFNSPLGCCPACHGLGVSDRLDPELLIADPSRSLRQGALTVSLPNGYLMYSQVTLNVLDQVCRAHGFNVDLPWNQLPDEHKHVVLWGSERIRIPYGKHPLESRLRWTGITPRPRQEGFYKGILPVMDEILRRSRNKNILRYVRTLPCEACGGSRLSPQALAVTFQGDNIAALSALPISELRAYFQAIRFDSQSEHAGNVVRDEVLKTCEPLLALGLGYLPISRDSSTLSGGEAQRLRLASFGRLGLRGVLYVLDEPSAGLHAADQRSLRDLLLSLRDQGNTVVVVEHDARLVSEADWIVDIGQAQGLKGAKSSFAGQRPRSPAR